MTSRIGNALFGPKKWFPGSGGHFLNGKDVSRVRNAVPVGKDSLFDHVIDASLVDYEQNKAKLLSLCGEK